MTSVYAPFYVGSQLQLGVGRVTCTVPWLCGVTKFSAAIGQRLPAS